MTNPGGVFGPPGDSRDGVDCNGDGVVAELFPSFDARSIAELRRIIIVLVFGSFKLCSRRTSSLLLILFTDDFLIAVWMRPRRGGNGGGLISRGGSYIYGNKWKRAKEKR